MSPRIALVHDWLNQHGGAERVLEVLHDLFPDAPVYTSFYEPSRLPDFYHDWDMRTTWMQHLPLATRYHQPFLPLYPFAFAKLDLSGYDLILSNSSGFCHGVPTPDGAVHLNYCLTPPRFLWSSETYLAREWAGSLLRLPLEPLLAALRRWDVASVRRVDAFAGISTAVVERIRRCYGREAALIHPPVDTEAFASVPEREVEDYYLIVGRLVPYRRIDLAIEACNRLRLPLLIVGEGRARAALERRAGPTVRFVGRQPVEEVARLMARCRAFIFPGEEDFGIAPVEAQAAGRPVVAYAAGGSLETVVDGETGVLFRDPTVESLIAAIERSRGIAFDPRRLRQHARQFDVAVFRERISAFVAEHLGAPARR